MDLFVSPLPGGLRGSTGGRHGARRGQRWNGTGEADSVSATAAMDPVGLVGEGRAGVLVPLIGNGAFARRRRRRVAYAFPKRHILAVIARHCH